MISFGESHASYGPIRGSHCSPQTEWGHYWHNGRSET